jgi:hypothetical protein
MPRQHVLAAVAICLALPACSVGLDPRRLELLHYGMPQRDVEPLLAAARARSR